MKHAPRNSFIILGFTLLVLSLFWAYKHYKNRNLEKLVIRIANTDRALFVNDSIVKEQINFKSDLWKCKKLKDLSMENMQSHLIKLPFIKTAKVYTTPQANLCIEIEQEIPIARIVYKNSSYYITESEKKIPLSKNYAAPVKLIQGAIQADEITKLISLFKKINGDNLLKNHLIGLVKQSTNRFIFVTNVNDFGVTLGDLNDIDEKISNLKAFYSHSKQIDITKYANIDLRFKNQVVAIKK